MNSAVSFGAGHRQIPDHFTDLGEKTDTDPTSDEQVEQFKQVFSKHGKGSEPVRPFRKVVESEKKQRAAFESNLEQVSRC